MEIKDNGRKGCPFCKSDFTFQDTSPILINHQYYIKCLNCGAEGPHKKDMAEAVEAWNRRAGEE